MGAWTVALGKSVGVALSLAITLRLATSPARADSTFVYAVQVTASVQTNPPAISLSWLSDPYGATGYTVYRKAKLAPAWGAPIASLSGTALAYTDTNVLIGTNYEYQIVKTTTNNTGYLVGYKGYGYILSGIQSPLTEDRGQILLVVATNATQSLTNELAQLQSDLVGDGWQVLRQDVSSNSPPAQVRALVIDLYHAHSNTLNTVFLFGHVPVLQSGNTNYDGHEVRPMPADAYYGELNDDWPTNAATSPNFLPSDVTLCVGRVDFFNMPGNGASPAWPSETELLRRYLNKDHAWRWHALSVPRRALMANRFGDQNGEAYAASGYRSFQPLVGTNNILEADISDAARASNRWISMVAAGPYLWSYGCGGGQDSAIAYLGTNASDYFNAYSTNLVGQDAKAVFSMFFGSHFGNWDHPDNLMRAMLATPTLGLACCMSGEPHWFVHSMGLGETIGYSTRLSMNNSNLYQTQTNPFTRAVYIALMGDPALRMEPLAPPQNLTATAAAGGVSLQWSASAEPVQGYHLYRADTPTGPFVRLTDQPTPQTNWTDRSAQPQVYTYMVRAVALQSNPSGTYFNASQGVFQTLDLRNWPGSMVLREQLSPQGLQLSWNSQSGQVYHLEETAGLQPVQWSNLSGALTATGQSASWTLTNWFAAPMGFLRLASP